MTVMILLMGEQPAANLLPARRHQPEAVVVVHSDKTQRQAVRLEKVLSGMEVVRLKVDPYRIESITADIHDRIVDGGWPASDLLFNLTGGTKAMSLAAYDVAQHLGVPFLYFQTEGSLSRIYQYSFDAGHHPQLTAIDDIPETLSLDNYLGLYLDDYEATQQWEPIKSSDSGALFEKVVGDALVEAGFEVLRNLYPKREGAVEIDLVFRFGNQIGIIEAKLSAGKRAIDQLVAVGSQGYLGTYVARFVVSGKPMERNNLNLAEAHRVRPIVLSGFSDEQKVLDAEDKQVLIEAIRDQMTPRR